MSRIIERPFCPHCGAELPRPTPRVCPACVGSLQRRYLEWGCLTSKPIWLLACAGAFAAARALGH